MYLIKVDLDAPDVSSPDRDHAEKPISPASEKGHSLVQNKKVFQSLCHVGGDRI